jgi:signal transduction histidine kinase
LLNAAHRVNVLPDPYDADDAAVRRCLGDVIALSKLAAVWADAQPARIAESLAAALHTMLGAQVVFVALNRPSGEPIASIVRSDRQPADLDIARVLAPTLVEWGRTHDLHEPFLYYSAPNARPMRFTCRQVGHDAELGLIAAGFRAEGTPTPLHHLLLDVSATQATTGLNNALLVDSLRRSQTAQAAVAADNARLLRAVQSANETLEQRVEERSRELTTAHEALRQAQKMEAVGQLTGGLAHDFNNLLAGISGALELIRIRMAQGRPAEIDRYLVAAEGAAKRAAALTHRLLAFSRRQTLDPKPTDVQRLVSGMTELIQRTVGPAITLEAVDALGLWPVLIDPSQLENAILNLCINARDAMPDGGKIVIETANRVLDDREACECGLAPGPYISLCVSDSGIGMPPDIVAKAFDPFFTTKPIGMGTGLGLSMIYGFARQSGGAVRIDSAPGQGTTVRIYLPRHSEAGAAKAADDEPGVAPRGHGETVLVVDDEPTVRMLVVEVLEDLGYIALEAHDAASGLAILNSRRRIDLLVSDVGLPGGMNGRQMADAARAQRPQLKVLFITGYAENAALSHGQLGSGMHVMTKPFAMEALAKRIRELIR